MMLAAAALLDGGSRLHLNHGPIDLIVSADPGEPGARDAAFDAARDRFGSILEELAGELPHLRADLREDPAIPTGSVAIRMDRAARKFLSGAFLSRMAAVAGAVADEMLSVLCAAAPLKRAYVNNGGDIALYLAPGNEYRTAMTGLDGQPLGRIEIPAGAGIGGIATSGAGGRSHSLGVADSVTVLGATAAEADVAATLIANAVDLPGHPGITRTPADELQPDSDLGERPVVTGVPRFLAEERARALGNGAKRACDYLATGRIAAASIALQGEQILLGDHMEKSKREALAQDGST